MLLHSLIVILYRDYNIECLVVERLVISTSPKLLLFFNDTAVWLYC